MGALRLPATAATAAAATTATAAISAAAAATAAEAAATAAAATTAAIFARLGLVDGQGATVVLLAVQGGNRRRGFFSRGHFDESEALAAAGVAIGDDLGRGDGAVLGEHLLQIGSAYGIGQVSNVQLLVTHDALQYGNTIDPRIYFQGRS